MEVQKGRSCKHPGKNGAAEEPRDHRARDGSLVSPSLRILILDC